jgi:hypothetical protein
MEIEPEAIDGEMEEFYRSMNADEIVSAGESQGVFGDMDEDVCVERGEDGQMSDVEADADTFASCGWGTDEDYGG